MAGSFESAQLLRRALAFRIGFDFVAEAAAISLPAAIVLAFLPMSSERPPSLAACCLFLAIHVPADGWETSV